MKNVASRSLQENEYFKWDEFVNTSPQGNIFNKSYWLKAVSKEFEIIVLEENGEIIAGITLPSMYGKLYSNPKLTPQLGILLPPVNEKAKYTKVLSRETEIMCTLLESIPKCKQFNYNMSYNLSNMLPFIWNEYKVTPRYTYVIEELKDIDLVYSEFQYDVKYLIKKALKNNIRVTSEFEIEDFYEVNKKTFTRQRLEMPYSIEFLKNLDKTLEKNNNRKMLFAVNEEDKIIAATYILYDSECAYYLMGGADPEYRNTGVQTLLLWESIKFASQVSKKFDFEGSMVKNIERSFREFGGKQKLIFNVYKSNFMYELAYSFARKNKNIIRKFLKV